MNKNQVHHWDNVMCQTHCCLSRVNQVRHLSDFFTLVFQPNSANSMSSRGTFYTISSTGEGSTRGQGLGRWGEKSFLFFSTNAPNLHFQICSKKKNNWHLFFLLCPILRRSPLIKNAYNKVDIRGYCQKN